MIEKNEKELADEFLEKCNILREEIARIIMGQEESVRLLIISIFCSGHSLLVGVPGLAKTLLINTLAQALNLDFSRIQFTPDLMPSDIIGAETLDRDRNFKFIKGPIFSNVVLADEINRTPPKTQSALLESMQEYAVTIGGTQHKLDRPFFVLATQNPIEQEGTYPLPEAQLDRFMLMIKLDYPDYQTEVKVIKNTTKNTHIAVKNVISKDEILTFQNLVRSVPVVDNVYEYAVSLVHKTRPGRVESSTLANDYLEWGAGPRASQFLILGAKCHALMTGKYAPDIEDVKAVAESVLRHRIVRNFKAEAAGISETQIIQDLL
ncbi:MAG: AAA family ATPase [Cyclobacteriaceae bacterium]|jgi:MoxR-like ATPase|nr:AAA family ATPase [Cyclobacteriaceae bacterium]